MRQYGAGSLPPAAEIIHRRTKRLSNFPARKNQPADRQMLSNFYRFPASQHGEMTA
jgi:hypothetical protein